MSVRETEGVVGTCPVRPDGRGKVTGTARYVDDLRVAGMWHGATVRSPHPSARLVGIDASAVMGDPDVVVVTAADLPGANAIHLINDDWPVLVGERTQHVGEAVALVAAPTREAARRAATKIKLAWEVLPAVTTLDEALSGDPRSANGPLVLATAGVERGDVDGAIRQAPNVIEGTYATGHQEHIYIETQGCLAIPHQDGGLEIHGSLQCPFYVHKALVPLFGFREDQVRIVPAVTGGGFGGKEDFPDVVAAHAALLARKSHRPVKLIYDRHEDIVATTKRHPSRIHIRSVARPDGVLVALDIDILLDGGAYTTLSPVVLSRAVLHAGGPYRCPNVRIKGRVIATNTVPNGAFRGFGAPQAQFAMERHLDAVARNLDLDPLTIRERNAYRAGDVTPTGQVLGEGTSALACLETAEKTTRFREVWRAREADRKARDPDAAAPWNGIGLSLFWHGTGFTGNGERRMRSPVRVRLAAGPKIEVLAAATDFGQGTETVLGQIVADAAGIAFTDVYVVVSDTAEVPDSGPTVASRTVMVVGGVLDRAARRLSAAVIDFAAEARGLEARALTFARGILRDDRGRDLGSFREWGEAFLATHGALEIEERYEPEASSTFDEATYQGEAYSAYGYGCDVVEVRVDSDTLEVQPERVTMVFDVGRAIHPVLCKGQIEGGTLQALAWGYLEELKVEGGHYRNDRLATYIIPTAMDVPAMTTVLLEHPASHGPFGAKGVGEIPMDGGAPAIVQAIENATGASLATIPATPERIVAALGQKKEAVR